MSEGHPWFRIPGSAIIVGMSRKLILVLCAFVLAGCASEAAEPADEVAIYLPAQPMSGREILAADLNNLELQPEPLIPASEIVRYSASKHDLTLTLAGMTRLPGFKIPVNGMGFVICVGKKPIAAGAFWTPISSLSFEGLTIQVPITRGDTRVHLYSGYPGFDEPLPNDPRDDPRLLNALQRAGKLE